MLANILREFLESEIVVSINLFATAQDFLDSDLESYDLIILDYHLNIQDFFAPTGELILDKLNELDINVPVILLSDMKKPEKVISLMGKGVLDFVHKSETLFLDLKKSILEIQVTKDVIDDLKSKDDEEGDLNKRLLFTTVFVLTLLFIL
jgi:FixJ family two-component response regulator